MFSKRLSRHLGKIRRCACRSCYDRRNYDTRPLGVRREAAALRADGYHI